MSGKKADGKEPVRNEPSKRTATPDEIARAYREFRYRLYKEKYTNGNLR